MTKNKIIKGLISGYCCDDEDDCILSCNDCIHQKFLDYEKQIRADAIDECKEKMKIAFIDVMRSYEGVIYPTKWIDDVLEQLKSQN